MTRPMGGRASALKLAGLLALVLFGGCRSCTAPDPPPPRPPPPPDPCQDVHGFDPCQCEISEYPVESLERRLREPTPTPAHREALAANLSAVAVYYKNRYWDEETEEDGILALRFYDSYLTLVRISDSLAPYALLHSIAIYCSLGCPERADSLATEVRRYHSYEADDLGQALSYCYGS